MTTSPVNAAAALREAFVFLRYRPADDEALIGTVNHDSSWSHCGPLLDSSSLPCSLHEFAAAAFTGSILPRLFPFLEFVNAFLVASGLNHYLFTIRATTTTHEFDRPRWHTDELFFSDGNLPGTQLGHSSQYEHGRSATAFFGTNWKICTAFLGPPTLFIPREHQSCAREKQRLIQKAASTNHACLSIRCVGCASAADVVREKLATALAQSGIETAMPGECTLFRIGRDSGAVHSEPSMSGNQHGRIFVNVVPGTKEELRRLMERWGMEFPRQWWVGSHVLRAHTE
ncbi:hypothetical protein TOPH_06499 [Tolypocladium ophioglossoides CBS 100239]|uniref:Uncharacterized protein n=1 Tax=Tolypocladium ophioglossoides (strain CBS 100239) TaxID=1163406 RepID=A0A0L0N4D3_TOLOC|nr:hypothetical protein TOPH_06499 [Tolypocladium ophioglossoides CBS 100239]